MCCFSFASRLKLHPVPLPSIDVGRNLSDQKYWSWSALSFQLFLASLGSAKSKSRYLKFPNIRQSLGSVWNMLYLICVFFFSNAPHIPLHFVVVNLFPMCFGCSSRSSLEIMLNLMCRLSFVFQVCLPARPGSGPRHRPGSDGLTCLARQG